MKITQVTPETGYRLNVMFDDGQRGLFDVTPCYSTLQWH